MAQAGQEFPNSRASGNGGAARDLREDLDALRSDIASLAGSVGNLAKERFGDAVGDAQDAANRKMNDVEHAIRSNPTQATLIAAGVGFLLGMFLIR